MDFGVIGIRSKHLSFFQAALKRLYPDGKHRITHICGYDAPLLRDSWPTLHWCESPQELISKTDAVIIALREGYQHAALAEMALKAKKPVFLDKPFTCDPKEAWEIVRLARGLSVPCTGGSTIAFTKEVRALKNEHPRQKHYALSYMADPFSPYGGWYFYGSHLTDLCVCLFGRDWSAVTARIQGNEVTAQVAYPSFTVTLHTSPETQPLRYTGTKTLVLDDQNCYCAGMAHFVDVIEGKETGPLENLAASSELMEAILTSISGQR